jgi:hypothetical protein
MSEFTIEYNNITYELNVDIINNYLYYISLDSYNKNIFTSQLNNIKKPIKYNLENKFIHLSYLKYTFYILKNHYNIDIDILYNNFKLELKKNESELNNLLQYLNKIRYDTVNVYSKFISDELVHFIYTEILTNGLENKELENKILNYNRVKYTESYDINMYISWLFAIHQEYILFYKVFVYLYHQISIPDFNQYNIFNKYNRINQISRPWIMHIINLKNKYIIIKSNIQFILRLIMEFFE